MKKRYQTLLLSYIIPYFLILLTITVSIFSILDLKDYQNQSVRTLYHWIELKSFAEKRFWFKGETTREEMHEVMFLFDESLRLLESDFPGIISGRDIKQNIADISGLWTYINETLLRIEDQYGNFLETDLGNRLQKHSFVDIVKDAYSEDQTLGKNVDMIGYLDLKKIDSSMNNIMDYISSESFFETRLIELNEAITSAVRLLIIIFFTATLLLSVIIMYSGMVYMRISMDEQQKNEESLSLTLNSIGDAMISVSKDGRVVRMNPSAESLTGWLHDESRGKSIDEIFILVDKISGEKVDNPVWEVLQSQISVKLSEHSLLLSRDGKMRNLSYSGSPILNIDGKMSGVVLVFRDITEKMKMEEALIQNEKLQSVGGLAAGMAHEINNPLAGILQTAGVLINRLDTNINMNANLKSADEFGIQLDSLKAFMEQRGIVKMLNSIRDSGQRMASLVSNMLSFARKSDDSKSPCSINDLIDKTLVLAETDYNLEKKYDFKLVKIIKDYADDIPSLMCEFSKIQQVILNILQNGAQAMFLTGTENLQFVIRTWFESGSGHVRIEIEDSGPGMNEVVKKKVFEPFFTTKAVGVGTGLGLSVSYFIITENHRGELSVESEPGYGAKFIILLPLS